MSEPFRVVINPVMEEWWKEHQPNTPYILSKPVPTGRTRQARAVKQNRSARRAVAKLKETQDE